MRAPFSRRPACLGLAGLGVALPVLLANCADEVLIVLDDTVRAGEGAVSDRWPAEHPELRRTVHDFEKGLHAFERRGQALK